LYRPNSIPNMKSDGTPGSCCAPARGPSTGAALATPRDVAPDAQRAMVSLPAGTFLMGTDYQKGFPADGEGPVRPVSLSAFDIDTYPVTNADFASFVAGTNFRTEAEVLSSGRTVSRPMATGYTLSPGTCGNGVPTGFILASPPSLCCTIRWGRQPERRR